MPPHSIYATVRIMYDSKVGTILKISHLDKPLESTYGVVLYIVAVHNHVLDIVHALL